MTPEVADIVRRHRSAWAEGRPFVIGVLGDFSRRSRDELPPLADRHFRDVRLDTLDALMAALAPVARIDVDDHLSGAGRLELEIGFGSLRDFDPDALLARVPRLADAVAGLVALERGPARAAAEHRLCAQLRAVLGSEPVRELEACWRALHGLLRALPELPALHVRVLDVSRAELLRSMKRYRGAAWDMSPFSQWVLRDELGTSGGRAFNLLLADYAFSYADEDIRFLADLARIADAASCVLIAAASPRLLGLGHHGAAGELRAPRRLFEAAAYAGWRDLRADADAGALALVLPRVLARPLHRVTLAAAGGAPFSEDGTDVSTLPWASAVYAVGARLFTDFVLRGGYGGLPDAPTGGVIEAGGACGARGNGLEGHFTPDVADELDDLGLIVVRQQAGSRHLHYTAARSLARGPADFLGWRLHAGHLMHGLRDLSRHLSGLVSTQREYREAMLAWLEGLCAPARPGADDPPTNRLRSASLEASAVEHGWGDAASPFWKTLRVVLSVEFRPLRPGRTERCVVRANVPGEGGPVP